MARAASRAAYRGREAVKTASYAPDPDELACLAEAVEALRGAIKDSKTVEDCASVTISAWITARVRTVASRRLPDMPVLTHGDAGRRGLIEAALPKIGEALATTIPPDVAFFSLPKADVVTIISTSIANVREAAVNWAEDQAFPFSDDIPF